MKSIKMEQAMMTCLGGRSRESCTIKAFPRLSMTLIRLRFRALSKRTAGIRVSCDRSGDLLKDPILDNLFIVAVSSDEVIDNHSDLKRIDLLVGILLTDRRNFRRIDPPRTLIVNVKIHVAADLEQSAAQEETQGINRDCMRAIEKAIVVDRNALMLPDQPHERSVIGSVELLRIADT
jgi:hypothetical protein